MSEIAYKKGERSPVTVKQKKHRKKSSSAAGSDRGSQQGIFEKTEAEQAEEKRLATLFSLNNRLEEVLAARRNGGDTIDLTLTTEVYQEHITKIEKKYEKNLKAQLTDAIHERDEALIRNAELESKLNLLEGRSVNFMNPYKTLPGYFLTQVSFNGVFYTLQRSSSTPWCA